MKSVTEQIIRKNFIDNSPLANFKEIFVFSIILFGYKNAVFLTFDTYVVFLNFKGMLKRNRPNYFSLYHVLKRIFAYTKEFIQSIKLT